MFRKLFIAGVIVLTAAPITFAQPKLIEKVSANEKEILIPFEKYILPNGLTVVIHEDHSDPVAYVDVTYHVGSAREEIGKSGFAHFFEHMMFNGSDNVPDEMHFKIITEAGGTLNGSTNLDRTNYYQLVPNNQLEKILWLEADRMGFLLDAVTQKKFEIQRSTVKNERGQNYDNRPYGLLREVIAKNLYPYGHPYSWLTIGYIEDLNRSNVNDLKNFFLRWYGPNNATLTVGGDIKAQDVLRMVEKYFGSIPRGPEVKPTVLEPVKLESNRYASYVDNYARLPQLQIIYPTVPDFHDDEAALACLAQVLGTGKNSIFYQSMVKTQKAISARAFSSLNELAGEFSISVTPFQGKSLTEMEELVNAALLKFEENGGVSEEDIQKFKSQYESRTILSLESVSGKVRQLAAFQTYRGTPDVLATQLKRYLAVTSDDVMRVYNKYIKNKNRLVVSALPKGKENLRAAPDNYVIKTDGYEAPDYGYDGLTYSKAEDVFDRKKLPPSGPNPIVKVPAFWKKTLKNGMSVIGSNNDELPVVNMTIAIQGGRLVEANDLSKAGVSNIFASMMNEDTKNYTAEQLNLELEKLGSSISVSNANDAILFTMQSLTKNLDKTLALLEERMFNPQFNENSFSRIKKQMLENIKNSKTTAATVASNVYASLNYGSQNIFGFPENGTIATVENISLDDMQNYYDSYIGNQQGRVIIVGNVNESKILPKLAFLDKLPSKKFVLPVVVKHPVINKTRIYLVDIPDAAQTEFRIGKVTGLKYDATGDYYKATLTNYNLGADFNSRINQNLREDKGYTYGARTAFAGDKYTGTFTFSSGIRADATDSALVEIVKEIKNFTEKGIRKDEITFMQSSMGQADARMYETLSQKSAFLGRMLQYDLPADYVKKQQVILKGITKADIDAIAKKHFDLNKMNIVLVGDKEKILPGLQNMGYEIVELDTDGKIIK